MRHNKNKIRPAKSNAPKPAVPVKPGHEVFKDEDYTDDEIIQSMCENARHALLDELEDEDGNIT